MLPQKRSRHPGTDMLPTGERAIADEATTAWRVTVDKQRESAIMLTRQGQSCTRPGDIKVPHVRAGRLDDARRAR
ncbi:hypothetical protein JL39_09575 [Rhizobium sp. YS-1r]|nr:hypothetical protein JL39_09575 [Rhizobium sp. YS-1r]